MSKLISPKYLNDNLDKYIILDCRFKLGDEHYGKKSYDLEHIPNAIFIDFEKNLSSEVKEHGGRHPLPKIDTFIENVEKLGISDSSDVLIYDDGDLAGSGRLWWLFKYIGKNNVFILNGGINSWKKENYLTTDKVPNLKSKAKLNIHIQDDILCDMNYVKSKIHDPKTILVDSRASERYLGLTEPVDRIPGHIPSAVNYPYTNSIINGSVVSNTELKENFKDLIDKDIIVYCGSGVTGSVNVLLMEEIGLKPKLYAGSYSDWVSYLDNDVEK